MRGDPGSQSQELQLIFSLALSLPSPLLFSLRDEQIVILHSSLNSYKVYGFHLSLDHIDQKKEGGEEEEAKYTICCLFNDPQRHLLFIPFYWQDSRRPRPQNWQFAEGELKRTLHYSCASFSTSHSHVEKSKAR